MRLHSYRMALRENYAPTETSLAVPQASSATGGGERSAVPALSAVRTIGAEVMCVRAVDFISILTPSPFLAGDT